MTDSVDVLITAERVPSYAHAGDAGADLHASESVMLAPGERATVGTGVAIALPDGYVAFVVPRSGLAFKHGITIVNSPGTVVGGRLGLLGGRPASVLDVAHAFTPCLCSPNPVEPNPPSPRMLPGSRSTSTNRARVTGITTSWAMRSPASIA